MWAFIQRVVHDLLVVHPPHTLFVHFPVALTTVALFFILLAIIFKKDIFEKIAFADLALAALSTIAAGIAGLHDNLTFFGGDAPNHTAKIILAITLFLVASATVLLRWRNPGVFHQKARAVYITGYCVCFALAAVLGFLGGVIIYGF